MTSAPLSAVLTPEGGGAGGGISRLEKPERVVTRSVAGTVQWSGRLEGKSNGHLVPADSSINTSFYSNVREVGAGVSL